MAATSLADDLAPFISFANLLGFAVAVWLLVRLRSSPLAPYLLPAAWILAIGTGLHALNDYVSPLIGFETFADDAYDHLFIHGVFLAALVALVMGVARAAAPKA